MQGSSYIFWFSPPARHKVGLNILHIWVCHSHIACFGRWNMIRRDVHYLQAERAYKSSNSLTCHSVHWSNSQSGTSSTGGHWTFKISRIFPLLTNLNKNIHFFCVLSNWPILTTARNVWHLIWQKFKIYARQCWESSDIYINYRKIWEVL